ncbi:MAG: hypothetical protein KDI33_20550 [Halioglobus sp.]|nr:hypothetical protein [Halioglobus sp.]
MRTKYCIEVKQEIVTPVEVYAESEQEAWQRVSRRDDSVTFYESVYCDPTIVLVRTVDE